jgi:aspartate kinase
MRCVVKKFGGACFADRDRLLQVAEKVMADPMPTAVVVSARQGVTDRLLGEMGELAGRRSSAALDLFLATGELQSAALVAAAIGLAGGRAEVVPPWKVFQTNGVAGDATIRSVVDGPVRSLLACGIVPVVPGFVGATEDGRLTTLGRGGSDYSAVALGVALRAERVELHKAEVDGVYTADPHRDAAARRFDSLTHAESLRLARAGGKVLQEKAAALAARWGLPVLVCPAFAPGQGTAIGFARPPADGERPALLAACG